MNNIESIHKNRKLKKGKYPSRLAIKDKGIRKNTNKNIRNFKKLEYFISVMTDINNVKIVFLLNGKYPKIILLLSPSLYCSL